MAESRPILRAGLTGGIASGKSTVAGFLAELGARVLDADRVARDLMEPGGAAHDEVVARFGAGIIDSRGRVLRPVLASIVFRDAAARETLDSIVHPKVTAEVDRWIQSCGNAGASPVAVVDAALLVESGVYRGLHRLIVTRCRRDTQIERLLARGLTREEAAVRVEAQASLERKLAVADYVIDTESSLRETRRQTERVYAALLDDFERIFDLGESGRSSPGG